MPSTTMLRIESPVGERGRRAPRPPPRARRPAAPAARRPRRGSPRLSSVTARTWAAMPVGFGLLASSRVVLGVVDRLGVVDQQIGDVAVEHAVPTLQARVVQRVLVGEVEQRALVFGARENLEQLRVERHARATVRTRPRMSASTSAVCASHAATSGASRFRRSSGSVLLGRRLNHQSPQSTVSPSSAVLLARRVLARDALDHRQRIVDPRVDLTALHVALERLAQLRERHVRRGTAARARSNAAIDPESARQLSRK